MVISGKSLYCSYAFGPCGGGQLPLSIRAGNGGAQAGNGGAQAGKESQAGNGSQGVALGWAEGWAGLLVPLQSCFGSSCDHISSCALEALTGSTSPCCQGSVSWAGHKVINNCNTELNFLSDVFFFFFFGRLFANT